MPVTCRVMWRMCGSCSLSLINAENRHDCACGIARQSQAHVGFSETEQEPMTLLITLSWAGTNVAVTSRHKIACPVCRSGVYPIPTSGNEKNHVGIGLFLGFLDTARRRS